MAGKTRLEGKNIEIALKMLHTVTTELEKTKVEYWLEGGTLLGVIRENRLLPWDNDMDISMNVTYRWKLILVTIKLILKGYRISTRFYNRDMGPFKKGELRMVKVRNFEKLFKKGDVMLDIFLKRKVNKEYYWTVGIKSPVLKSSPAEFYDKLTKVKFDKKEYLIPQDFEGYLSYRYGNWKKTVKQWDFKKDDNAIVQTKEHK
ncbi:MAG: LicD family protein [Candidatus Tenebribacter mawsonii]|nr:LicD family protein [Candidatus Tenebribacter mawsonii]